MWVPVGTVCVGGFNGVLWLGICMHFARKNDGGVVLPLFRDWICGISLGCVLGGDVWLLNVRLFHFKCCWGGRSYRYLEEYCECDFATL